MAKYAIRPANQHDFTVLCDMNVDWPSFGGPKQIGALGYQSGTCLTPPKVNARRVNSRWKPEYGAARKCVESAFSVLVGAALETYLSLRLKVALSVLAHNLKFFDLTT